MTASTPAAISSLAFSGSLFAAPYVTHTSPLAFTTEASLGHVTIVSAADTIPSKFHLRANLMALCSELARTSAIGCVPASVRYKIGIDGCFKESSTHTSGWNDEKMMSLPSAFSYTTFSTVST
ncbi:hypothetical protein OGATHE_003620 [Ogataea polymorpha]|uniref:Uncharacterized protein n=1 Tax=Ogataea polymorpha TaxID=460523 RepID=A0A9P8T487_9ASCO|nr:hypothetical protein OGATHE_003620 [Ogataea polymorpha]